MKKSIFSLFRIALLLLVSCGGQKDSKTTDETETITKTELPASGHWDGTGTVVYLSQDDFASQVFDFRNEKNWNYKGTVPCVIDFYADWCKPCKLVAPIMDELAAKYKGKVQFFKINIDMEKDLTNAFRIQSIPSILVCPMQGNPVMTQGVLPQNEYERLLDEIVFKQK